MSYILSPQLLHLDELTSASDSSRSPPLPPFLAALSDAMAACGYAGDHKESAFAFGRYIAWAQHAAFQPLLFAILGLRRLRSFVMEMPASVCTISLVMLQKTVSFASRLMVCMFACLLTPCDIHHQLPSAISPAFFHKL